MFEKNQLPEVRPFDGHDWFSTKTYRRNLPHWELKGSTYFITIRVDADCGESFRNPQLAHIMIDALLVGHKSKYLLYAYVVMPDHVHLLIKPIAGHTLGKIMQYLKGSTAHSINKALNRSGKFWQTESFDHLIRDQIGLSKKWEYIKQNPVTAKLTKSGEDYPFSSFYEGNRLKPVETRAD